MVKKTSQARRDGRPRLNEAQLQAYRARKADTVANPAAKPDRPDPISQQSAATGTVTSWGHVGDEYAMIRSDLIRLLIITAAMFVIILVLWFFLG